MLEYGTAGRGGCDAGQGRPDVRGQGAGLQHRGRGGARPPAPTPRSSTCRRMARRGAIIEAADAGIPLIVCITEGIPVMHMSRAMPFVRSRGVAADRPQLSRASSRPAPGQGRHHPRQHLHARAGSAWCRAAARSPTRWSTTSPGTASARAPASASAAIPIIGTNFIDCLARLPGRPRDRRHRHDRRDRRHRRAEARRRS